MGKGYQKQLIQYKLLHQFFKHHGQILMPKRGFQSRFDRFCIKKSVISVTAAHLEIVKGADVSVTRKLRATLCELAESICMVLAHSGKTEYYPQGGFAAEVLEEMNDEQLTGYCKGIYQMISDNPDAFIKQGIVLKVRNTLSGAIDVYHASTSSTVAQTSLVQYYHNMLDKYADEMETLLKNEFDVFITRLRLMKPALVKEYKQLRKIK
jgi:hypothetical protein